MWSIAPQYPSIDQAIHALATEAQPSVLRYLNRMATSNPGAAEIPHRNSKTYIECLQELKSSPLPQNMAIGLARDPVGWVARGAKTAKARLEFEETRHSGGFTDSHMLPEVSIKLCSSLGGDIYLWCRSSCHPEGPVVSWSNMACGTNVLVVRGRKSRGVLPCGASRQDAQVLVTSQYNQVESQQRRDSPQQVGCLL